MARDSSQKIKLLKLLTILHDETNEDNQLSTNELIKRLSDEEISIERKSLYKDIDDLNDFGFDIIKNYKDKSNYYYIGSRWLEDVEIKILIDAILAAKFITLNKSKTLIDKLLIIAGKINADSLKNNINLENLNKHSNTQTFYNIDNIYKAISKKKQISFIYKDFRENNKLEPRNNGERYLVDPFDLIISNDNYYLIAYCEKSKIQKTYRVDRINDVNIEEQSIPDNIKYDKDCRKKMKKQVFDMYSGEEKIVKMIVHKSLINCIIDKFGENTKFFDYDDEHVMINEIVQISPTFYGWCFTFGDKIKILEPKDVIESMKIFMQHIESLYQS